MPKRRFSTTRRVRLGDVNTQGRLRLDALARYLQDIAFDDATDAGLGDDARMWVVRAIDVTIGGPLPTFGQDIELTTWCGGVGPRWAERRTAIDGGIVETNTLWVHIDAEGRPAPLPPGFMAAYGDSAMDHKVSVRLTLPEPPAPQAPQAPPAPQRAPWPIRATDHDVLGHVNNAVYWAAVEEVIGGAHPPPATLRLEHRTPIAAGTPAVELVTDHDRQLLWLVSDTVHAAAKMG